MTTDELLMKLAGLGVHKSKLRKYLERHFPDLLGEVMSRTAFLDSDGLAHPFAERMYCLRTGMTGLATCPTRWVRRLEFRTDVSRYRENCSKWCVSRSRKTVERRNMTREERYGDANYVNIEKSRGTRAAKNGGGWHPGDFRRKVEATSLRRHGDRLWRNLEKARLTNLDRYDVEYPLQSHDVQRRCAESFGSRHVGLGCALRLSGPGEKTKAGIRRRAWRRVAAPKDVVPLFSESEFMAVDDITKKDCLRFRCPACGTEFASSWNDGLHRRCPACFPELHGTSRQETELVDFLKSVADSDRVSTKCGRNRLPSGKEVDAVVDMPSGVVGVEYDGLYWHSEQAGKGRLYHLSKTLECEASGIRLVHVFENEWLSKGKIVKSRLRSALGLYDRTVYARRCAVRRVSASESRRFQDENHMQGAPGAKVSLSLYLGDDLVSLMTFGKCRFDKKHEWELVRFCSKLNTKVIGGAGDCSGVSRRITSRFRW
jgi:hypothetical protein